jgi:5-methylcytosine-specific restriction endonuclease McrA
MWEVIMARPFAEPFYKSKAWVKCRAAFLSSKHWECERCGVPATVAHHKQHLSPRNINDPSVSLSWDNLQALCADCHAAVHRKFKPMQFDANGDLIPPGSEKQTGNPETG